MALIQSMRVRRVRHTSLTVVPLIIRYLRCIPMLHLLMSAGEEVEHIDLVPISTMELESPLYVQASVMVRFTIRQSGEQIGSGAPIVAVMQVMLLAFTLEVWCATVPSSLLSLM